MSTHRLGLKRLDPYNTRQVTLLRPSELVSAPDPQRQALRTRSQITMLGGELDVPYSMTAGHQQHDGRRCILGVPMNYRTLYASCMRGQVENPMPSIGRLDEF